VRVRRWRSTHREEQDREGEKEKDKKEEERESDRGPCLLSYSPLPSLAPKGGTLEGPRNSCPPEPGPGLLCPATNRLVH
jgi:hypothetical protein